MTFKHGDVVLVAHNNRHIGSSWEGCIGIVKGSRSYRTTTVRIIKMYEHNIAALGNVIGKDIEFPTAGLETALSVNLTKLEKVIYS